MIAAFGLLLSGPIAARYVPDTSIAPAGVIDISIRGEGALSPGAVYTSIAGNEFVTISQRDNVLAICEFTTSALLQTGFGGSGCYRDTLSATEFAYQLLVGRSGYWVFIGDTSKPSRFTLLRLTASGQPDVSYGASGRRGLVLRG